MFDLHRHTGFSVFDGFGDCLDLANIAKDLGYNALGISDHGNTNGLIKHYEACNEVGIKPVMGVEAYFKPVLNDERKSFHLCIFAKNLEGYKTINKLMSEAEKQKYYTPLIDFKLLEKYNEGIIVTSACIGSYSSQAIKEGKPNMAYKYFQKMKKIFKSDFYIEIQPYKIDEEATQETVDNVAMKMADKLGIKCILTSDSHRGRKEDFDTYLIMHEMAKHDKYDISATYKERYMPTEKEILDRFLCMYTPSMNGQAKWSIDKTMVRGKQMLSNLDEIYNKVENNILDGLQLQLPELDTGDKTSKQKLTADIIAGLKERGKYNKEYIARCKEELEVITHHGFEDYFLIVADYVKWGKEQGIIMGAGRGSVCNSEVAFALGITEVDSILHGLDFRRFLRIGKKSFPDIDLDFETDRRGEVIEYIINKYKGHSAQIVSYGLYKVDNLVNDLAKVCGLKCTKGEENAKENKIVIKEVKDLCGSYIFDGKLDVDGLLNDSQSIRYNKCYNNIIKHFSKMYLKVKYIGTHAAGVAITGGNIMDYTALRLDKDGAIYTNYDLSDLEKINVIKFDILGLGTLSSIGELRAMAKIDNFKEEWLKDPVIYQGFREGKTDGVFQFESRTPKKILENINCDCFEDVVATNSMNRPGSLMLHQPEMYAVNKYDEDIRNNKYYEYTKDSYGTIIYQEQIQAICVNIGGYDWDNADAILKVAKHGLDHAMKMLEKHLKAGNDLQKIFITNAIKNGLTKEEAQQLFNSILTYSFNKGHATGYSMISVEEMFYKLYYPTEFWFTKIKYESDEMKIRKFCEMASANNVVVFLPHVNLSGVTATMRKVEGENIIQQGLTITKDVGEKASQYIVEERKKNGIFTSYDNFYDRCKSRTVTVRVISAMKETGALEFNKKKYIERVTKYNGALYMRGTA